MSILDHIHKDLQPNKVILVIILAALSLVVVEALSEFLKKPSLVITDVYYDIVYQDAPTNRTVLRAGDKIIVTLIAPQKSTFSFDIESLSGSGNLVSINFTQPPQESSNPITYKFTESYPVTTDHFINSVPSDYDGAGSYQIRGKLQQLRGAITMLAHKSENEQESKIKIDVKAPPLEVDVNEKDDNGNYVGLTSPTNTTELRISCSTEPLATLSVIIENGNTGDIIFDNLGADNADPTGAFVVTWAPVPGEYDIIIHVTATDAAGNQTDLVPIIQVSIDNQARIIN